MSPPANYAYIWLLTLDSLVISKLGVKTCRFHFSIPTFLGGGGVTTYLLAASDGTGARHWKPTFGSQHIYRCVSKLRGGSCIGCPKPWTCVFLKKVPSLKSSPMLAWGTRPDICQGVAKPGLPGYFWVDRKCLPPASSSGYLVGSIEALRDNHCVVKWYSL